MVSSTATKMLAAEKVMARDDQALNQRREAGQAALQLGRLAGPGLPVEAEEHVDLHQRADDLVVIEIKAEEAGPMRCPESERSVVSTRRVRPIQSRYTSRKAMLYLRLARIATTRPSRLVHIETRWSNSTSMVNQPRPRAELERAA